jgi:hypothetical protein
VTFSDVRGSANYFPPSGPVKDTAFGEFAVFKLRNVETPAQAEGAMGFRLENIHDAQERDA